MCKDYHGNGNQSEHNQEKISHIMWSLLKHQNT